MWGGICITAPSPLMPSGASCSGRRWIVAWPWRSGSKPPVRCRNRQGAIRSERSAGPPQQGLLHFQHGDLRLPAVLSSAPADPVVLHADPWLLVIDKPSGLLSQSGRGPALADAVPARLEPAWGPLRLPHRLDRDTSGLLLLARDPETHRSLSMALEARRVRRTYLADVAGWPSSPAGRGRRPWPRPATGHPFIGCIPPAGPVAPTGGAWSGGMVGAGCGWSPTPVVPTSCGSIWPGWVTRSWGIPFMALRAVEAPLAGCGCMPGDSTWCIPAPVSPSASRLPCPGMVRGRRRSRCKLTDLPRSPGGGLWVLSADPGVPPRWGLAGPGPRRCGAAGDRRELLGWSASPVQSGAGWARGSPPGRDGPGPWGWLELVLSWSIWSC